MPTFYTKGLKLKSSQSNFSTGFLSCKIDGRSRWTGISITNASRQCMECLFDRMEYSGRVCLKKKKKKRSQNKQFLDSELPFGQKKAKLQSI